MASSVVVAHEAPKPPVGRLTAREHEWILGAGAEVLKLSTLQARVLARCLSEGSFITDRLGIAFGASRQAVYGAIGALRRRGLLEVTSSVREGLCIRRTVVPGPSLRALLNMLEGPAAASR